MPILIDDRRHALRNVVEGLYGLCSTAGADRVDRFSATAIVDGKPGEPPAQVRPRRNHKCLAVEGDVSKLDPSIIGVDFADEVGLPRSLDLCRGAIHRFATRLARRPIPTRATSRRSRPPWSRQSTQPGSARARTLERIEEIYRIGCRARLAYN